MWHAFLFFVAPGVVGVDDYESVCDRMVKFARSAGRAFNAGDRATARRLVGQVEEAFEAAKGETIGACK